MLKLIYSIFSISCIIFYEYCIIMYKYKISLITFTEKTNLGNWIFVLHYYFVSIFFSWYINIFFKNLQFNDAERWLLENQQFISTLLCPTYNQLVCIFTMGFILLVTSVLLLWLIHFTSSIYIGKSIDRIRIANPHIRILANNIRKTLKNKLHKPSPPLVPYPQPRKPHIPEPSSFLIDRTLILSQHNEIRSQLNASAMMRIVSSSFIFLFNQNKYRTQRLILYILKIKI